MSARLFVQVPLVGADVRQMFTIGMHATINVMLSCKRLLGSECFPLTGTRFVVLLQGNIKLKISTEYRYD